MNIFLLDYDLTKSAQYAHDKHVVKMPTETAQILSQIRWQQGLMSPMKPLSMGHNKHPCVLWAAKSQANYQWLVAFGKAQCAEYSFRYNKTIKSEETILFCEKSPVHLPDIGMTPFALAMPEEYRTPDPVQSYRNYYLAEKLTWGMRGKLYSNNWTKRGKPEWLK